MFGSGRKLIGSLLIVARDSKVGEGRRHGPGGLCRASVGRAPGRGGVRQVCQRIRHWVSLQANPHFLHLWRLGPNSLRRWGGRCMCSDRNLGWAGQTEQLAGDGGFSGCRTEAPGPTGHCPPAQRWDGNHREQRGNGKHGDDKAAVRNAQATPARTTASRGPLFTQARLSASAWRGPRMPRARTSRPLNCSVDGTQWRLTGNRCWRSWCRAGHPPGPPAQRWPAAGPGQSWSTGTWGTRSGS